jgi:hypothetical protein
MPRAKGVTPSPALRNNAQGAMEPEKFKADLAKIKTKPPEGINNKPHDAS